MTTTMDTPTRTTCTCGRPARPRDDTCGQPACVRHAIAIDTAAARREG